MTMKKIDKGMSKIWSWFTRLDWRSPSVIIAALCIGLLPFVARYYVFTGLFMGLILALSVLWPLEKAPEGMKRLVVSHPLAADIILSTLATIVVGAYFGSGLVLGIAATFCGIVLSYLLPMIKLKPMEPVMAVA